MKLSKFLLAGAFALAFVQFSQAASTTIHIVGAQAWRAQVYAAIGNILNTGYTFGFSGTSLNASNQAIFTGTTATGSNPVIIKTSFAGATGGVQTLTQNLTVSNFLADGTSGAGVNTFEPAVTADVATVDSPQATTVFTSPALVDQPVGIEPYVWVKGVKPPDATGDITNITSFQAQNLLAGGLPLQQFTGNSADSVVGVYAVGRDENSGARIIAFAESGFGIFSSPKQKQPTITSNVITKLSNWPANTVNGIPYGVGHSGYSSSNQVTTALAASVNSGVGWIVSYLGASDAAGVNGGANNLTWNGVPYSLDNVKNGLYTFWGYARVLYRSSYSGIGKTVTDQIITQLTNADFATPYSVLLQDMKVNRQLDGGPVTY